MNQPAQPQDIAPDPTWQVRNQEAQERIICHSQALSMAATLYHGTGDIDAMLKAVERIKPGIWDSAAPARRLREESAGLRPGAGDVQH